MLKFAAPASRSNLPRLLRFAFIVPLLLCLVSVFTYDAEARVSSIICRRIPSNVSDDSLTLNRAIRVRAERFIMRIYPTSAMRRASRSHESPLLRKASYDIVRLKGIRYAIVAYVAEFREPALFVHDFAIYRYGKEGFVQVWRSVPWIANYYGLSFETAQTPNRVLVLFKEGGLDPSGFSLSGVLAFREVKNGFLLHDLTPRLPFVRALTQFPSRALYGKKVTLEEQPAHTILLSASDEAFAPEEDIHPVTNWWQFNNRRGRFEEIKQEMKEERKEAPTQPEEPTEPISLQ